MKKSKWTRRKALGMMWIDEAFNSQKVFISVMKGLGNDIWERIKGVAMILAWGARDFLMLWVLSEVGAIVDDDDNFFVFLPFSLTRVLEPWVWPCLFVVNLLV